MQIENNRKIGGMKKVSFLIPDDLSERFEIMLKKTKTTKVGLMESSIESICRFYESHGYIHMPLKVTPVDRVAKAKRSFKDADGDGYPENWEIDESQVSSAKQLAQMKDDLKKAKETLDRIEGRTPKIRKPANKTQKGSKGNQRTA